MKEEFDPGQYMASNQAQQLQAFFGNNGSGSKGSGSKEGINTFAEDIPTLSSVVLSGDETVIHSARLKHNLTSIECALAAGGLSLEDFKDLADEPEFICESNLKTLIDKVIESHTTRMKSEIVAILKAHGVDTDSTAS